MVRFMKPVKALDVLKFTPKAAAKDLAKAIQTALANAKQKGLSAENMNFEKLEVNESLKMRRMRAGTRGRAKPYKKRMAHIRIVLSDTQVQSENKNEVKNVKAMEKKEVVSKTEDKKVTEKTVKKEKK